MRAGVSECVARPAGDGVLPLLVTLMELPATNRAPGLARAGVRRALAPWQPGELTEAAVLAVSELVTNAQKFAAGPAAGGETPGVLVEVSAVPGRVVLEVTDADGPPLVPRDAGPDDDGGRGLLIVGELSTDWSWFCTIGRPGRKTVRCVIGA